MRAWLAGAAVLTIASADAGAAPSSTPLPEASVGAQLARSVCAECHAIGADASAHSRDEKAPRFLDVAKMASTTELSLKVFLQSSHRNMPNFMLSSEEIDSVAAYILSLRAR